MQICGTDKDEVPAIFLYLTISMPPHCARINLKICKEQVSAKLVWN